MSFHVKIFVLLVGHSGCLCIYLTFKQVYLMIIFLKNYETKTTFSSLKRHTMVKVQLTRLGYNPPDIYLFKINNENTRTMCEICSKSTVKAPERRQCLYCKIGTDFTPCSGVSIVEFEQVNVFITSVYSVHIWENKAQENCVFGYFWPSESTIIKNC